MNVNMERAEENIMQQYREETVKLKKSLSSFHSIVQAFLSLSRSPEPICWGQKTRTLKPEGESKSPLYIKGKSEAKEDQE